MASPSGLIYPGNIIFPGTEILPITFEPPVRIKVAAGRDRFWRHFDTTQCVSILKFGSSYQQIQNPGDDQIQAADMTYLGGHIYPVTSEEADALVAAGYAAGIVVAPGSANSGYSAGQYGAGPYGA